MRSFLYIVVLLVGLAGVLAVLPLAPFQTVGVSAQAAPAANTGMSQNIQQQAMGAANQTNPTFGCGSSFSIEGCGTMAAYYIMKGCAWIAVWASVILNYVIMELVVGMGVLVGNMPGVAHAWEMLRDLTNVFLVFITVYIGISIIVGASNFGSKQMLGRIILAALLVNFSITVAKLVIDVSNVTAITAYDMILKQNADDFKTTVVRPGECAQVSEKAYDPAENTCITTGLAGVFWSRLQMTKIFNVADFQAQDGKKADDALIWVGLLGAIMFIIMAFVFGAMAFMLIGRFLILVMLIIFSPLAFVSLITGISGKGRVWWTMLINQSIVAPVMFIMLWITYGLLDGFSNRFELKGGIAKSAMADMGAMGIVTYFMIICGSLIMSLIVAKELGAYGASAAMSTGKNWSKKAGFALAGGTGYVAGRTVGGAVGLSARMGRKVIGGTGDRVANSTAVKNLVSSQDTGLKGWAKRTTGRVLRKTGAGAANSSFDLRAAPGLGSSKLVQKYGGAAQKGGYTQSIVEKNKRVQDEKDWLAKNTTTAKEGKERDAQQREVMRVQERVSAYDIQKEDRTLESKIADAKNNTEALNRNVEEARKVGKLTPELQNKYDSALKKEGELEGLSQQLNERKVTREEIATGMNSSTGKSLNPAELQQLTNRLATLDTDIKSNYGVADADVAKLDSEIKDLETQHAAATGTNKQALEKQIENVRNERNTLVSLFETNRELYEMEKWETAKPDQAAVEGLKKQANAAKQKMTVFNTERSRNIDKKYSDKASAQASQRVDNYLTQLGTERTLGFIATPKWKRETAVRLRKPSGEKQLLSDMEKVFKEFKKNESPAPVTEAPQTPPVV